MVVWSSLDSLSGLVRDTDLEYACPAGADGHLGSRVWVLLPPPLFCFLESTQLHMALGAARLLGVGFHSTGFLAAGQSYLLPPGTCPEAHDVGDCRQAIPAAGTLRLKPTVHKSPADVWAELGCEGLQ